MSCDCAGCGHDMTSAKQHSDTTASHNGRGLCSPCYERARYEGRLDDYPRTTWSRDELMSEWDHLRQSGVSWRDAHTRLSVSESAFKRAYERARAAGDNRAIDGPGQRGFADTRAVVDRARDAIRAATTPEPAGWATPDTRTHELEEVAS